MKTMFKTVFAVFVAMLLIGAAPANAERHYNGDMSQGQLKSLATQSIAGWWLIGPYYIGGIELVPSKVMQNIIEVEWYDDDGTFYVITDAGDGRQTIMEGWRDWADTLGYGEGHLCMHMTVPSGNVHTLIKAE